MKYRYHPENIIITSGGTVTPIDKMRVLTNKAAGTTGALLAEEMLQNQQKVTFITTGRSVLPYTHKLQLQPLSCTPEEAK